MAAKKLPKRLFVRWEEEQSDEPFLICSETSVEQADFSRRVPVGVYELQETGEIQTEVNYRKSK